MEMEVGFFVTILALYLSTSLFCNVERYLLRILPLLSIMVLILHHGFNISNPFLQTSTKDTSKDSFIHGSFFYQPLLSSLTTIISSTFSSTTIFLFQDFFILFFVWKMYTFLMTYTRSLRQTTMKKLWNSTGGLLLSWAKSIPILSTYIASEMASIESNIHDMLTSSNALEKRTMLPKEGIPDKDLLSKMKEWSMSEDLKWQNGKLSGGVYHGEPAHTDVLNAAYAYYSVSNPLHADIWPSVMRMESEIIAMTADLMSSKNISEVCGSMASGGTESIFLAAKTHRDWYRDMHNITSPEIIAGVTAHAAIDKACDIMGIKLIKVPVDAITFQMDLSAVKWAINANTIMLYGSAPSFPQGIIDDIEGLSTLACQYQVGLHVDCCLGGFVLPFMRKLGHEVPPFDFDLPGVTSMSCDTHKYGYAAKGTSVVLYANKKIRRYQYFTFPEWTGGLYVTPTIAGSRPGALSAACWASLMRLGEDGFLDKTRDIISAAMTIKRGIEAMEGLSVLGDPQVMVVSFTSRDVNIFRVGDLMAKKGWSLNSLQFPACLHICITLRHLTIVDLFLDDLQMSLTTLLENPDADKDKNATSAIYGLATSMPSGPVDSILRTYTDCALDG